MRRLFLVATSLALLLLLPRLPLAAAQEDPGALLKKLAELDNVKDEQGLVALFAPDGVIALKPFSAMDKADKGLVALFGTDGVIVSPGPEELDRTKTYTGTDQIRAWVKSDTEGDAEDDRTELGEITVQGNTASAPFKVYTNDDRLKQAGLDPILGTAQVTAKDGKIARFSIALDRKWMKKATMAFAAQGVGDQVAATTGGKGPGELPATGEAPDPLPLALAAGLGLLGIGLVLRRAHRAD